MIQNLSTPNASRQIFKKNKVRINFKKMFIFLIGAIRNAI